MGGNEGDKIYRAINNELSEREKKKKKKKMFLWVCVVVETWNEGREEEDDKICSSKNGENIWVCCGQ